MSRWTVLSVISCACIGAASLFGSSTQQAKVPCGVERWPVKTLTDLDRSKVNFTPVETTVAKLAALRIHDVPYPRDRRIAPEELQVYRVRAKLLIGLRHERDSDVHLFLVDPDHSDTMMIAEIPAPECAKGSGYEDEFRRSRSLAQSLRVGTMVEITGIGFFDFIHNPPIGAKNGIELHPVLTIKALQ